MPQGKESNFQTHTHSKLACVRVVLWYLYLACIRTRASRLYGLLVCSNIPQCHEMYLAYLLCVLIGVLDENISRMQVAVDEVILKNLLAIK